MKFKFELFTPTPLGGAGFPIHFSARGGNGPPLRGGTQGGGFGQVGGGMPRETSRQ